ncbi:MAG: hypothetical protein ACXABY_02460 [Candidatus Thorarchaeota archaeon]|jgi:hypothetical protein
MYQLVWLPTGEVQGPDEITQELAMERNAALAGQGIMNFRWMPVEAIEPDEGLSRVDESIISRLTGGRFRNI